MELEEEEAVAPLMVPGRGESSGVDFFGDFKVSGKAKSSASSSSLGIHIM